MFFKKKVSALDFGAHLAFEGGTAFQEAIYKAQNTSDNFLLERHEFDPRDCDFDYAKFGCMWMNGQAEAFARATNDIQAVKVLFGSDQSVNEFAARYSIGDFNTKIRPMIVRTITADLNNHDFQGFAKLIVKESWKKRGSLDVAAVKMISMEFDTSRRRTLALYKSIKLI